MRARSSFSWSSKFDQVPFGCVCVWWWSGKEVTDKPWISRSAKVFSLSLSLRDCPDAHTHTHTQDRQEPIYTHTHRIVSMCWHLEWYSFATAVRLKRNIDNKTATTIVTNVFRPSRSSFHLFVFNLGHVPNIQVALYSSTQGKQNDHHHFWLCTSWCVCVDKKVIFDLGCVILPSCLSLSSHFFWKSRFSETFFISQNVAEFNHISSLLILRTPWLMSSFVLKWQLQQTATI